MRTFLFLQLLLPFALSGQTTWAPVGARWTYLTTAGQPPWSGGYGQYTVSVVGDTTINDQLCSIIHFPVGTDCGFPDEGTEQRDIFTCVRSDSVFWYNEVNGSFDLIMDYGASSGDEWRIPLHYNNGIEVLYDTATYHIWSVDTLWYAGEPLRRLHHSTTLTTGLFQGGTAESVERLGDTGYLIPWRTCDDGNFEGPLLCYSEDGFSWPTPDVPCGIWLGTRANAKPEFSVFPSVVQCGHQFTVTMDQQLTGEVSITIHDLLGELIRIIPVYSTNTSIDLDRTGVFVLTARSGNGISAQQRIVVE